MRRFLILVLVGILLVACDQASTPKPIATQAAQSGATQQPQSVATATDAYPAPDNAYPAPSASASADGYPPPSPLTQGPKFTLNTPVRASDAKVTGKGPAGVPVKLVNVARSGEVIGETTIGSDGTFTVEAPAKLIAGDRIALMLGNTAGTKFNPDDFISGPDYQDYPLLGIMFASTVVQ
jgi:Bacterial Ig domain